MLRLVALKLDKR
ncbi:UNVERIFIED_CONTAM: hypothetical protein GTU68_065823 [Idotea baltica]|nr:hypothetical protein [Idotea baltica]